MKIVQPYARMLDPRFPEWSEYDGFTGDSGIALLRRVEWFGRISHRSEEAQTKDSWERFIRAVVVGKGDWSITEHCVVSVEAVVDRGVTHEWVRHRIGAYTQESTRFVNYEKKMPPSFIRPESLDEMSYHSGDPSKSPIQNREDAREKWNDAIAHCEFAYQAIVRAGYPPQIARSVFPNALASKIIVTYNLRNWRHFLIMRTTREAHPQMREVTIPLLKEFQEKIPILYEDIITGEQQSKAIAKAR